MLYSFHLQGGADTPPVDIRRVFFHDECMAGRPFVLATGEYYHIFNRGIARQPVFFGKRDYQRFLLTLSYYRHANPPVKLSRYLQLSISQRDQFLLQMEKNPDLLVDIICIALMPNHFHLLLKQVSEKGISAFMSKTVNSYTRYVNTVQERAGDLFQGVFKAVHVETNEQLLHLSRYIHLNPVVSHRVKKNELLSYPWTSLPLYAGKAPQFVSPEIILSQFNTKAAYTQFVLDQADYGKTLEEIKHLTLE